MQAVIDYLDALVARMRTPEARAAAREMFRLETFQVRAEALVGEARADLAAPIEGDVDL